jgi:hypothetical protein
VAGHLSRIREGAFHLLPHRRSVGSSIEGVSGPAGRP